MNRRKRYTKQLVSLVLAVFISANLLSVINSIKGEEIGKYDLPSADIRIRSIQEQEDDVFQISGELEAVLRVEDLYEGISSVSYTVDTDGLVWSYNYPVEEMPQQDGADPEYSRYETGDYREWDLVWDSEGRVVSMSRCIRICPEDEATILLSFINGKGDSYSCRQTMVPVIIKQQEPEDSIQELPRGEEEQDEKYDQETENVQAEEGPFELDEEGEKKTEDPEESSSEESVSEAGSAAAEDLISEEELLTEETESESAAESELSAESETEEDPVPEMESETADETEPVTELEPEPELEPELASEPALEAVSEPELESESLPEPESEPEPVLEVEPVPELESESLPEPESEPEPILEVESEPEPEPEPVPLPEETVMETQIEQQDEPRELLQEAEPQPQMPVTQSYEAPVYYYPQYSAVPAPTYRNTYTPPAASYSPAGPSNTSGTRPQSPGTGDAAGYDPEGDTEEADKPAGMESEEAEIPTKEAEKETAETREKEEETYREKIHTEGSAYDISEIEDLIGKCLQEVPDLVIYENNADTIDLETVKVLAARNTETFELEKEADYTVKLTGLSEELKTYKYVIDKSVFEEEGSYRVFLFSEDATGNSNSSEGKDTPIWFTVDVSSPLILSCEDTIEQKERNIREVRVKDNTGLSAVDIYLGDRKMEYETEGETYRFRVPEEIERSDVKVVARDEAGNTYERILPGYVTAGKPKMHPANAAPVIMIAAAAAAAAISMILIRKKKKRRN
ncbi:MAG: hypothetical protein IJJ17_01045 [Parasporobacterium sp.]|nr:hypothetical protein [Parasporobacterium sp.]